MSTPDIVGVISQEMLTDDEDQSQRLIDLYESFDWQRQEAIDEVLMCICGWSFESLKAMAVERGMVVED